MGSGQTRSSGRQIENSRTRNPDDPCYSRIHSHRGHDKIILLRACDISRRYCESQALLLLILVAEPLLVFPHLFCLGIILVIFVDQLTPTLDEPVRELGIYLEVIC
jgi:hypothetical protein